MRENTINVSQYSWYSDWYCNVVPFECNSRALQLQQSLRWGLCWNGSYRNRLKGCGLNWSGLKYPKVGWVFGFHNSGNFLTRWITTAQEDPLLFQHFNSSSGLQCCGKIPTFRGTLLPGWTAPEDECRMTLQNAGILPQHHPEELGLNLHHRENFGSIPALAWRDE